ncbi:MAG: desulfoferrodoxin family protein [Erysipelotrichaceae bacterium]
MKLLKCAVCGNVVEMIEDKGVPVICCGQAMNVLVANTSDGALEKHVPVMEVKDDVLFVQVGSVEHPMLPEHFITEIFVEYGNNIARASLKPGSKPTASFNLNGYKGLVHVYEYCNIHGLWKGEIQL